MFPDYTNQHQLNECGEVVYRQVARNGKVEIVPFLSLSFVGRVMTRYALKKYREQGAWKKRFAPGITEAQRAIIVGTEKFLQEFASTRQEVDVLKLIRNLGGQIDTDAYRWMGVKQFDLPTVTQ
jgi:hypothetical protein